MPTHRQLSFIGTLWHQGHPVQTLDALVGHTVWIHKVGTPLANNLASTVRNVSARLSCQPGVETRPLQLYWRHTDKGYQLYIRSVGEHFGKRIQVHPEGFMEAFGEAQRPTPLKITSESGSALGLEQLGTHNVVRLRSANAGLARFAAHGHQYIAALEGPGDRWFLKILSRNEPWLSSPDEP